MSTKSKKVEEELDLDDNMDLLSKDNLIPIPKEIEEPQEEFEASPFLGYKDQESGFTLPRKRVLVKHIPKEGGMVTDPKHILYGGMSNRAFKKFTVPQLSSGLYVNILTDEEKRCLEEMMNLEINYFSIYKKKDNFWDNYTVRLTKDSNVLDLSSPDDYIKYKVLLANKSIIAPNLDELNEHPKATYQFVLVPEGDDTKVDKTNMDYTVNSYVEFGKISENKDTLRVLIETIDSKPVDANANLAFLQTRVHKLIQSDSKLFHSIITSSTLKTRVLIRQLLDAKILAKRGSYYYVIENNKPLCGNGQEPTLHTAVKYLDDPKNQDFKYSLEVKLK